MKRLTEFLPFLSWIKTYDKTQLKGDLSAGLTVGVLLIPQGMAYAMIAGLPPVYGLYAALIPQVVYMFLGTSRQLSVGPVAMDSLLVATIVSAMAKNEENYIELALLLAFLMGIIQFVFGLLRFGFLVNFLSKPVITGFTSAAALIIGLNQVKHLVGADISRNSNIIFLIRDIFKSISSFHLISLCIGIMGIAVLFFLKKHFKKVPGALVIVVAGTLIIYLFGLNETGYDVKIVGDIPSGLPAIKFPNFFDYELIKEIFPSALTIALIAFMESISVAKSIEEKHNNYSVNANQEMIALGMSNIIGSIFSSYPVTGGFSRSAVNDQSGAKTGMASFISAVLVFITLLFLTSYFYYLPKAILASIIMVAVYGLIDFKTPIKIWRTSKIEFMIYLLTFVSTLTLGIQQGIGFGVLISLLVIIYYVTYPHIAELAKLAGQGTYMNINRFKEFDIDDELLIVRMDARLFYANVSYFKEKVESFYQKRKNTIKGIIISASAMNDIDYSGVNQIEDLIVSYQRIGVAVYFIGLKGPIRDKLKRNGFTEKYGETHCFLTIEDAIKFHKTGKFSQDNDIRLQSND